MKGTKGKSSLVMAETQLTVVNQPHTKLVGRLKCKSSVKAQKTLNSQAMLRKKDRAEGNHITRRQTILHKVTEKEMATHSGILVWRILWKEEPGGLLSMGSHRVGHD